MRGDIKAKQEVKVNLEHPVQEVYQVLLGQKVNGVNEE